MSDGAAAFGGMLLLMGIVFIIIMAVLAFFLPLFVLRIRKEAIITNEKLSMLINNIQCIADIHATNTLKTDSTDSSQDIRITTPVVVREFPIESFMPLGSLSPNDVIRIEKSKDGWSKITVLLGNKDLNHGWVRSVDLPNAYS